jgi:hypothetical protein
MAARFAATRRQYACAMRNNDILTTMRCLRFQFTLGVLLGCVAVVASWLALGMYVWARPYVPLAMPLVGLLGITACLHGLLRNRSHGWLIAALVAPVIVAGCLAAAVYR